ncbi:MAG: HigA family addiction module antitoxin [Clostridia bacterium]|nr:HigA family addiction module antitoxin [Clostridia bacterium]
MTDIAEGLGLHRSYIIHPGETLAEFLEDRGMTQKELAVRTGMSTDHIRAVIHGRKPITAVFAHRLEYALGVKAYFWLNLQSDHDRELAEYDDFHSIRPEEAELLPRFKATIDGWISGGVVKPDEHPARLVIRLRRALNISCLCDLPRLSQKGQ